MRSMWIDRDYSTLGKALIGCSSYPWQYFNPTVPSVYKMSSYPRFPLNIVLTTSTTHDEFVPPQKITDQHDV